MVTWSVCRGWFGFGHDHKENVSRCDVMNINVIGFIDNLRIVPRLIAGGYAYLIWVVCLWFMSIDAPSTEQAAFVSAVVAIGAPIFNFYVNSGGRGGASK